MEALRKALYYASLRRGQRVSKIKATSRFGRKLMAHKNDPDIMWVPNRTVSGLSFFDLAYCGIPVEIDNRMNSDDFELVFEEK